LDLLSANFKFFFVGIIHRNKERSSKTLVTSQKGKLAKLGDKMRLPQSNSHLLKTWPEKLQNKKGLNDGDW
jgi:hypothetical protein